MLWNASVLDRYTYFAMRRTTQFSNKPARIRTWTVIKAPVAVAGDNADGRSWGRQFD